MACARYDGTPTSDFFDLVGSLYLQVSGVQRLGVEAVRLLGDPTNALSRVIRKVTGGVLLLSLNLLSSGASRMKMPTGFVNTEPEVPSDSHASITGCLGADSRPPQPTSDTQS